MVPTELQVLLVHQAILGHLAHLARLALTVDLGQPALQVLTDRKDQLVHKGLKEIRVHQELAIKVDKVLQVLRDQSVIKALQALKVHKAQQALKDLKAAKAQQGLKVHRARKARKVHKVRPDKTA